MATLRISSDGISFDLSHAEVTSMGEAQNVTLAVLPILGAAIQLFVADLTLKAALGVAAAALAATIGVHKAEILAADKGFGVEMTLPWWAWFIGWFGALLFTGLPGPSSSSSSGLSMPAAGPLWPSLGGYQLRAHPAAALNADGRQQVFVIGGNGELYTDWQTTGTGAPWSGWVPLGGSSLKLPLVAARGNDGRLYVLAVGGDGQVCSKSQVGPNGGWADAWAGPAGLQVASFAPALNKDGRMEVAALGADGSLYHASQSSPDGSWGAWASLGGHALQGNVAFGANADGRLEAFVAGGDGIVYHIWQTQPGGPAWSGWAGLGDPSLPAVVDVTLARRADGRLVIFMMRADGALSYRAQSAPNGGWAAPVHLGGNQLLWPCVAAAGSDGRLHVFVTGSNHYVYENMEPDPTRPDIWSGWGTATGGANVQAGIALTVPSGSPFTLYAVGGDGQLYSSPVA